MKEALLAKKNYPSLICGFDMVQEEDAFKNMTEMAPALIKMKQLQEDMGVDLPFVFHGNIRLQSTS